MNLFGAHMMAYKVLWIIMIFVQVQNKMVFRMIYSHLLHVQIFRYARERERSPFAVYMQRGADCTSKDHSSANGGMRRRRRAGDGGDGELWQKHQQQKKKRKYDFDYSMNMKWIARKRWRVPMTTTATLCSIQYTNEFKCRSLSGAVVEPSWRVCSAVSSECHKCSVQLARAVTMAVDSVDVSYNWENDVCCQNAILYE